MLHNPELIVSIGHFQRKLRTELKNIELQEEAIASNDFSDAEAQQVRIINKRMLLDQAQDDIWFEVMNPPHDSFPEYITAVVQFSLLHASVWCCQ